MMASIHAASVATPSRYRNLMARLTGSVREPFRTAGQWTVFIGQTLWLLPWVFRRYRRQTLQAMNSLAWGRGSLIVDGGADQRPSHHWRGGRSIATAMEAHSVYLNIIGFGAVVGSHRRGGRRWKVSWSQLVAGIAFTAQAGTRMTAEIGAMRISEEIDAVEVLGLRPIPFVVGTRLIGGLTCVIPGLFIDLGSRPSTCWS